MLIGEPQQWPRPGDGRGLEEAVHSDGRHGLFLIIEAALLHGSRLRHAARRSGAFGGEWGGHGVGGAGRVALCHWMIFPFCGANALRARRKSPGEESDTNMANSQNTAAAETHIASPRGYFTATTYSAENQCALHREAKRHPRVRRGCQGN